MYALIALGYTMVYGIAKMLNFAHGDIIMVGGYVIYVIMLRLGGEAIPAVLAALAACCLLGVTVEKVAYKPLRGASPLAVLITAIGVSYCLESLARDHLFFRSENSDYFGCTEQPCRHRLFFHQLCHAPDFGRNDCDHGGVDLVY